MLQVTFVHEDCFVVELDRHVLVFDYIPKDALLESDPPIRLHGHLPELPADKRLFFFVSNGNRDAYSPEIFRVLRERKDTVYILPKDLKITREVKAQYGIGAGDRRRILRIGVRSEKKVLDLTVATLNPNTTGVAYLVNCEGLNIYFAGDLNWWNFGGEHEMYSNMSGGNYRREMRHLKEKHIDLAFVDLDGRLGSGAKLGIKYFLEHVPADLVFPMHLWQDFRRIDDLKEDPEIVKLRDKVVSIDREDIVFQIR